MHTRRTDSQNLIPIDLEIEATARKQGTKRRHNKKKEAMGGEAPAKFLWEYGIPDTTTGILSSIVRPAVTASHFELKLEFIQFISNDSFSGSPNDCPVSHIDSFLEKCDTMKINNISDDAIRLRLFSFSLRDKAKEWLRDEGAGSFDTWDKLVKAFLVKFLGQEKTARLRNELTTFRQTDDESLYESWRRFKRLQRQCPHHGIQEWFLIQTFYNGLTHEYRIYIDAASGGSITEKNPTEAKALIEKMAANDNYHPSSRNSVRKGGKYDLDALTILTSTVQTLSHKIDQFGAGSSSLVASCQICGVQGHTPIHCQLNTSRNTYHSSGNNNFHPFNTNFTQQSGFQQGSPISPPQPQTSKLNLDSILETLATSQVQQKEIMTKQFELQAKQNEHFEKSIQQLIAQNKVIETQLVQLSQQVIHLSKPRDPPKIQNEQCSAIFLKDDGASVERFVEKDGEVLGMIKEKGVREKVPIYVSPPPYEEPVPFPQRLTKGLLDKHFGRYSETLKKVYETIPFSDLLIQMPKFAKFLKEILANDRNCDKSKNVIVNELCSTLMHENLPPKLKDPGVFTIPCMINETYFDRALCDLGASVNLIPYSLYEKLGLKELKHSPISLQMADKTARFPKGIVEDVLVKVGEFSFLVDFVVMDMKEDFDIPLIFGRPFLATSQALIDVPKGQMIIKAQDNQVVFKIFDDPNFTFDGDTCMRIDATNPWVDKCVQNKNYFSKEDIPISSNGSDYQKKGVGADLVDSSLKELLGGRYNFRFHRGNFSSLDDPG
ncbi:uncharacterized protein [Spinacia oleracea]|uniref:Retrotransposon gag domain-containing protein n=1 Tax=Spinacia oleracea TaxID=3562 RepID=A0A9R0I8W1_SPIOL|nr:uncharacterized protein LOC110784706 [Spinacia oleracea]